MTSLFTTATIPSASLSAGAFCAVFARAGAGAPSCATLGIAKVARPIQTSQVKHPRKLFALFVELVIAIAFKLAIELAIIRTFQIY
jgi:hypothetical protein